MAVEFSTTEYEFNHGKAPRGHGTWAFSIQGGHAWFAPPSSFTDAKKWARDQARKLAPTFASGTVRVVVLP